MSDPFNIIARTWVQSWDQHIGKDGAQAIVDALSEAGMKIVSKDDTEAMLERLKSKQGAR